MNEIIKPNRATRRALARMKRLQDKRQLRHDTKKRVQCPACDLDFLGKVERCQCNISTIELLQAFKRIERSM